MFTEVTERLFGRMHRGEDRRATVMQSFTQHVAQCLRSMGAQALYTEDFAVCGLPDQRKDVIEDQEFALHGFIEQFPLFSAVIEVTPLACGDEVLVFEPHEALGALSHDHLDDCTGRGGGFAAFSGP